MWHGFLSYLRSLTGYDEPNILHCSRGYKCLRGADVGHAALPAADEKLGAEQCGFDGTGPNPAIQSGDEVGSGYSSIADIPAEFLRARPEHGNEKFPSEKKFPLRNELYDVHLQT